MRIIEAIVGDPRHGPAPDRWEAEVVLTFEPRLGAPAETRTLLTSASGEDPKGRDIRVRLVADAVRRALTEPVAAAA
jgi:hypothetical protein